MGAKRKMSMRLKRTLLGSVLTFMSDSGLAEQEIRATFEACMEGLRKKQKAIHNDGVYQSLGDLSADLLRMWHRDDRYVDYEQAKPRALQLIRGRNSIRAIALQLNPKANVPALVEFLLTSGLIHKAADERYLPTTEAGAISRSERFVSEHAVKSIIRLISTVRRNSALGSRAQPLIERFAYVSDLRPAEIAAFCEFTRDQGHSYLQVVDDWMEQRRASKNCKKPGDNAGVVAGVHVIAYLNDTANFVEKSSLGSSKKKGNEGTDGEIVKRSPKRLTPLPATPS